MDRIFASDNGDLGNVLDSIDWKFYSAIDGITTFRNVSILGMCRRYLEF